MVRYAMSDASRDEAQVALSGKNDLTRLFFLSLK